MKTVSFRVIGVLVFVLGICGGGPAAQPIKVLTYQADKEERPGFLAFVDDGQRLLTAANNRGWVRIWNLSTGKIEGSFQTMWPAYACQLSPDRKTLAAFTTLSNWRVRMYDISRREPVGSIPHGGKIAFSPNGKTLAIADDEQDVIRLWDIAGNRVAATLKEVGKRVGHIAFCADGSLLATVSRESTVIRLWEIKSGREAAVLQAHPEAEQVDAFAVSQDGKWLASSGLRLGKRISAAKLGLNDENYTIRDNLGAEIKLWDPHTGKLLKTLPALKWYNKVLSFSPNGKFLISGSEKSIIVWDTATWSALKTLEHADTIICAAVSPDGKLLAAASCDNCISLWKIGD